MLISSVLATNPFGPVHENVKGPTLPATVIFIVPLKGKAQRELSVTMLVSEIAGATSPTFRPAAAVHPEIGSVTVTL